MLTVEYLMSEIESLTKEREDYKAKYSEALTAFKEVMIERNGLAAARYAYATEFPLDEEGQPDVGSIHQNIRALKADHAKVMKAAKLALDALNQSVPGEYDFEECFEAREALRQAGVQ